MGEIFRAAFQGLQRNAGVLLFYLGVNVATYSARMLIGSLVIGPRQEELSENAVLLYFLLSEIVTVAIIAFAQTIAFSRMGREIDRPMWRIADDREAMRRFYQMWVLLGLANVVFMQSQALITTNSSDPSTLLTLAFMTMAVSVLLLLFGTSVMFYGRFAKDEVLEAISTLMHQFPRTLLLTVIGLFFMMFFVSLQLEVPDWARVILAVAGAYIECFLFVCMWLICMYDRDDVSRPDDSDFDL